MTGSVVIGLSAVVIAIQDGEAVVLTVRPEDLRTRRASVLPGLPSGPFDPVARRTFELALLHVAVLGLAAMFGVQFILRMHRYLAQRSAGERLFDGRVLAAWLLLFLLVSAQMACFMGPLMSEGPFFSGERGLFVGAFYRLMGR